MNSDVQNQQNLHRLKHISPLRYPGGKAALADFLAHTLALNNLNGCSYFEPLAGGAGAALLLLLKGVIAELHLNDLDPRIVAFWKAVFNESERFAEAILTVPVNIAEWRRQSEICLQADSSKTFELGFATFYLNRCNRSGVITGAAPIGGYSQESNWKIDARFYREQLSTRVCVLADLRDQIHVTGMDAQDFLVQQLPRGHKRQNVFVYLDPPYYANGRRLYMNSYDDRDHRNLSYYLRRQRILKWVASYDDSEYIRRLYASCQVFDNILQYSLQRKRLAKELLIAPSHVRLPSSIDPRGDVALSVA